MASKSVREVGQLSWFKCQSLLRGKKSVSIGYQTWISEDDIKDENGHAIYRVIHFRTPILSFYLDGVVIANAAGYRSSTTKERIANLSGANLYQKKYVWYVGKLEYYDGVNLGTPRNEQEALENAAMRGDEVALLAMADRAKE